MEQLICSAIMQLVHQKFVLQLNSKGYHFLLISRNLIIIRYSYINVLIKLTKERYNFKLITFTRDILIKIIKIEDKVLYFISTLLYIILFNSVV